MMRRSLVLPALAVTLVAACGRSATRDAAPDSAGTAAAAPADARATADPGDAPRAPALDDTLAPLEPAPRAPHVLTIDTTRSGPGTLVGANEPATPLCAIGLRDTATGLTFELVRAKQATSRTPGRRDSTTWGRADYRPSEPARFGMEQDQVLRVDCVTRRVLGIARDITTADSASTSTR